MDEEFGQFVAARADRPGWHGLDRQDDLALHQASIGDALMRAPRTQADDGAGDREAQHQTGASLT